MKLPTIGIAGTHGIPAKHGGFETFAAELAPRLVAKGFQTTVYCGKEAGAPSEWRGARLRHLSTTKAQNPLRYYAESVYHCLRENDIALVTGTGGSIFYPLNALYRRRLFTNTDGVERLRGKWSVPKRIYVAASERLAVRLSTGLIADSTGILNYLRDRYGSAVNASVIEYGAEINTDRDTEVIDNI